MKKACNPREPEETPFQSSNHQNTREAQVLYSSASKHHALCNTSLSCQCSSRPDSQNFFSTCSTCMILFRAYRIPIFLSKQWPHGLMASPNKPSLSATAVEFLHSCESRRAARNSKFGATLRNSDICELHIDQMTCPVSKCQCNSFMESKCIDVNALPAMSFTVYSRSASPVRLDSHRPSCSRTSSLPTVFHKAWQEGRWRFWKN